MHKRITSTSWTFGNWKTPDHFRGGDLLKSLAAWGAGTDFGDCSVSVLLDEVVFCAWQIVVEHSHNGVEHLGWNFEIYMLVIQECNRAPWWKDLVKKWINLLEIWFALHESCLLEVVKNFITVIWSAVQCARKGVCRRFTFFFCFINERNVA